MKKVLIIIASVLLVLLVIIGVLVGIYFSGLTPANKHDSQETTFIVNQGDSKIDIVNNLKEQSLIKSKFSLYIYVLLNHNLNLQAGEYSLSPNMSAKSIIKKIADGNIVNVDNTTSIKFIEGKRITDYVPLIAQASNTSEEEVYALLKDDTYIKSLIDEYWFLTTDILDDDIYYPLEGYLFASTYEIYKDSSAQDIIKKMLDGTKNVLEPYKADIENSPYSIHELLTMASIVELEGVNSDDREGVAGVFYNRLNAHDSLGSDVTTYYAVQKDFSQELFQAELDNCNNGYNTRNGCNAGKLPIGPISSPSLASIKAAIYPSEHDYYYFVADKNKKTYFTHTYNEHMAKVAELKASNLWFEY